MKFVEKDFTREAKEIVDSIYQINKDNKRFGYKHMLDIYLGSKNQKIMQFNHQKLPFHGKGKPLGKIDADRVLRKLICEDFLREELYTTTADFTATNVSVGEKAKSLSRGESNFKMQFAENKLPVANQTVATDTNVSNSDVNENCYQELLGILMEIAREKHMHNYANVLPLTALREMATKLPETKEEFLQITHISDLWYGKYASRFLNTIRSFKQIRLLTKEYEDGLNDIMIEDFSESEEESTFKPSTSSGRNSRKTSSAAIRSKYFGKRTQSSSSSANTRNKKTKTTTKSTYSRN